MLHRCREEPDPICFLSLISCGDDFLLLLVQPQEIKKSQIFCLPMHKLKKPENAGCFLISTVLSRLNRCEFFHVIRGRRDLKFLRCLQQKEYFMSVREYRNKAQHFKFFVYKRKFQKPSTPNQQNQNTFSLLDSSRGIMENMMMKDIDRF